MKTTFMSVAVAAFLLVRSFSASAADDPAANAGVPRRVRIGVFDSRAVAIAYAPCKIHSEYMRHLKARHDRAKESGDEKQIRQIEREAAGQQALLHRQGFSTGSVRNILRYVEDRVPAVAEKMNVDLIVSKWEVVHAGESIECVDVTPQIVELFDPSERTLKIVAQLKGHEPLPIEKLTGHECK
jgi:hypothetical protein